MPQVDQDQRTSDFLEMALNPPPPQKTLGLHMHLPGDNSVDEARNMGELGRLKQPDTLSHSGCSGAALNKLW